MLESFLDLFAGADVFYLILMAVALCLFVAELFIPSFGIVGISGMFMLGFAIAIRCLYLNDALIIFYFAFWSIIVDGVIVAIINVFRIAFKKAERKVKVKLTENGSIDYSFLVGKVGEVVADLKPYGKAKFDDKIYDVTTIKEYLYAGNEVKVIEVSNGRIVVKGLDKE